MKLLNCLTGHLFQWKENGIFGKNRFAQMENVIPGLSIDNLVCTCTCTTNI